MITPRSALKFDLFADASRKRKLDTNGDPLQVIAEHIDFAHLATLVDAFIERSDGHKGARPAYPTEVMVRILVLKRLYNLADEQMEYQLLDRMSYQRFCLLQNSMNVPDRNTVWRFSERIRADGATALFQAVAHSCTTTAVSPEVDRPLMRRWCKRPRQRMGSRPCPQLVFLIRRANSGYTPVLCNNASAHQRPKAFVNGVKSPKTKPWLLAAARAL